MRTRSKGVKIPKKFDNATLTAPGPVAQQTERRPPKTRVVSAILTGVTEEWRGIAWAPGYQVSSHGRVRNANRRILKTCPNNRGRAQAFLSVNGVVQRPLVSRLVAEAFIGPAPADMQVDHVDGDYSNNAATNLEYVTRQENVKRYVRLRRAKAQAALIWSLMDGGISRKRAQEYVRMVDAIASEMASDQARIAQNIAACAVQEMVSQ